MIRIKSVDYEKFIFLLCVLAFLFTTGCKSKSAKEQSDQPVLQDEYVSSISQAAQTFKNNIDSLKQLMELDYECGDYEAYTKHSHEVDEVFDGYVRFITIRTMCEYRVFEYEDIHDLIEKRPDLNERYKIQRDSCFPELVKFCLEVATS